MSKTQRKSASESSRIRRGSDAGARQAAITASLVAALVGYVVLFCLQPLDPQAVDAQGRPIPRWQYASWLLVQPEYLVSVWTGGDWSRVEVRDRWRVLWPAAVIVVLAWAAGDLLLRALRVASSMSRLERGVFALAAGLNLISLYVLAIGLAGWLHAGMLVGLAATLVVSHAVLWSKGRRARDGASERRDGRRVGGDVQGGWAGLLWSLPFVAVVIAGSMLPPRDFDVREYHLQVPKEWYQRGRIDFVPHNVYGNMPLGAEMHALAGMMLSSGPRAWWWGALAGKTVIGGYAVLAMLGLFAAGRRFISARAGWAAALLFISTPWVAKISMAGLVEVALGCYLLLGFCAVIVWWEEGASRRPADERRSNDGQQIGWLALAGFLVGSAAACKYTGLLFGVLPLLVFVAVVRRMAWKPLLIVLLSVVAGCGLWLGKNAVLCGNPIYPLVFGGKTRTVEKREQWGRAHQVPRDEQGRRYSAAQLASAWLRIGLRSSGLSPLLVPLAVMGLVLVRRRWVWWCGGYALFYFAVWWLVTHRLDRFWVPLLPAAALLAGAGYAWSSDRVWRWAAGGLLAVVLVFNGLLVASPFGGDLRILVSLEDLRLDVPRESDPTPSRVNPAHRWLNQHVPDGWRVLLVGDAQPFDLEVEVLYNTCFDDCWCERLLKGRDAGQRLRELHNHRIAYVLVDWRELARYRSPGNYGYAAGSDFVQPALFDELVSQRVLEGPVVIDDLPADAAAMVQVFHVVGAPRR